LRRLVYEQFVSDPRVREARRLLLEALSDHQNRIQGPRPPQPGRKPLFDSKLQRLARVRGRPLALRYLGSGIGNGTLVELEDGSIKYDFISGIGVHYLGHSHPAVVEACLKSAFQDAVMQGNLQQNEETLTLSERLLEIASSHGAKLDHCFLTTSGAMANENGLKIAFQKQFPAERILAFEKGFAGRTLALSQVTDRPIYRHGLPQTLSVDYVPFFDPEHPAQGTERAISVLKGHLARYPRQHAAMIFELVLGEGGFYPGHRDFFKPLMELLKSEKIIVLVDEIQTFGRTPEPFAFQYFGLDDYVDLVTMGKLTQVCATLFRSELKPTPELVSQTFAASTSAIMAGRAILDHLLEGGYFGPEGKISRLHVDLKARLEDLAARHPGWLSGPFGIGSMVAFTPLDGSKETAKTVVQTLFEEGVVSFMAGDNPSRIRFLVPAGAISLEDVEAVVAILERSLARVANKSAGTGGKPRSRRGVKT
jgi:4-aminobutyrate aminotransferase-like enzyme